MPQVERIRDPSQEARQGGPQQACRAEDRRLRAADDHERGAHGGQQRGGPGERCRLVQDDPGEHDQCEACPSGRRGDPLREEAESRAGNGEGAAERQLPGARGQREERPRLRGRGEPEREHERRGGDGDDRDPDAASGKDRAARHEQDDGGPEEVELLLDAERPEVEDRRWRLPHREVVRRLHRESHVRDVERSGCRVGRDARDQEGRQQDERCDEGDDQDERRGGQQAPRPARVEAREGDRPAGRPFPQQEPGDQEAGDDEEDVDPHEPAGDTPDRGVEQDDQHDGDRAQALDVTSTIGVGRRDGNAPARHAPVGPRHPEPVARRAAARCARPDGRLILAGRLPLRPPRDRGRAAGAGHRPAAPVRPAKLRAMLASIPRMRVVSATGIRCRWAARPSMAGSYRIAAEPPAARPSRPSVQDDPEMPGGSSGTARDGLDNRSLRMQPFCLQ